MKSKAIVGVALLAAVILVVGYRKLWPSGLSATNASSISAAGVTITTQDVMDFEHQQLVRDARGADISDIRLPRIASLVQQTACFPSLMDHPIPKFPFYMTFWSDMRLPTRQDQEYGVNKQNEHKQFCLHGIQVMMDDPTSPVIRDFSTEVPISKYAKRNCAALPRPNQFSGLDLFCFNSGNSEVEAIVSVVSTDPRNLPDGTEIFSLAKYVVGRIPAEAKTVAEGSPACEEFRRQFGSGDCSGPFSTEEHSVQVRIDDGFYAFHVIQCVDPTSGTDSCLLGVLQDVLLTIRQKASQSAPAPQL